MPIYKLDLLIRKLDSKLKFLYKNLKIFYSFIILFIIILSFLSLLCLHQIKQPKTINVKFKYI